MPAARRTPTGTHRTASESGAETRDRLQAAARACLRQDGIAGVSARAIARHGDLNQALVFYHFGSVDGLLQAVARTDAERRALLYAERLAGVKTLKDLVSVGHQIPRSSSPKGTPQFWPNWSPARRRHRNWARRYRTECRPGRRWWRTHWPGFWPTHRWAR